MDGDGDVDFDDIDALVLALVNPSDYEAMYGVPPERRGDIDRDGDNDFDRRSSYKTSEFVWRKGSYTRTVP